jgi:hypothetical protein
MSLLIWLHVAAMIVAITIFVGAGVAVRTIAMRADPATTRAVIGMTAPLFRIGGIAVGVGIIAGLVLARTYGFLAPWLIGAYLLTIVAAGLGNGVEARWAQRLAASDDASFEAIRHERLAAISGPLGYAVWLAILWLMIAKPSW